MARTLADAISPSTKPSRELTVVAAVAVVAMVVDAAAAVVVVTAAVAAVIAITIVTSANHAGKTFEPRTTQIYPALSV